MDYDQVRENEETKVQTSWKPFMRQLFVVLSPWTLNFLLGMSYGLPTVMVPQIRRDANSTEAISEDMASWLYSVIGYSSLPWVVIVCFSIGRFGRKIPFALISVVTFATFILLYFSTSLYHILLAECMLGVPQACNLSLNIIVVLEYVSPKHRSIFITIKSANFFWGVWTSNVIGTFCSWRYVPLLGIFLSLFGMVIPVIFWPESPQWLASKGKFGKCRISHRWLRGTDAESEKELEELVQSQIDYKDVTIETRHSLLRRALITVRSKAFYKPMLLAVLLVVQYNMTGKTILVVYAIEIIKKITNSESTAYMGMLILDATTLVALYTGCILSKIVYRRTLLLSCASLGIAFLLTTSLYLFLIESKVIAENNIIYLVLLTLVSIFIGCGPMILLTPIAGEVTPLRYKTSITLISTLVFLLLCSTALKLFPLLCSIFRLSGTLLFLAVSSILCCILVYKYLPETKDKTLQEIENVITGRKTIVLKNKTLTDVK